MRGGSLFLAMGTLALGILLPFVFITNSSTDTPIPLMFACSFVVLVAGMSVSEFRRHRRLHWLVAATMLFLFAMFMILVAVGHAF